MSDLYESRYSGDQYYWGLRPSSTCSKVVEIIPPDTSPLTLLDIGCGEGRNSVYFASRGYRVTAFDTSSKGIEKTNRLAESAEVSITVFKADIREFRLTERFDIIFSTGVLQYLSQDLRMVIMENYRQHTSRGGVNVHSVFVRKPFIPRAPDSEATAYDWHSGELLGHFSDWRIEFTNEEIFRCLSGGVPHEHAISRVIAKNMGSG